MKYEIKSGEVLANILYCVTGDQSIVYNSVNYVTSQTFRGIPGETLFTYLGSGSQSLNEVEELRGCTLELFSDGNDGIAFRELTILNGFVIEFNLTEADKITNEITQINGLSVEFIDYGFYSFIIDTIAL